MGYMRDSTGRRLDSIPISSTTEAAAKFTAQPIPVATRAAPPFQTGNGLSDGVLTGGTGVIRHTAVRTCFGLRLAYSNHYPASSGGAVETPGPNPITVKASIDYPTGVLFPVTFNGQTTVTIQPGATVISDPVGIDLVKGTNFWTRTYVSVTSGQSFPRGAYATHSGNGEGHNYSSAGGADVTTSGAVPAGGFNEYVYSPAAILGLPIDGGKAVIAAVGDSIVAGTGDDQTGWVTRLLGNNYSLQKVAYPSESMVQWVTNNKVNCYRRAGLLARVGITHVIAEHIVNDLGASGIATLQTNAYAYWKYLSRIGKVYATTCTPITTSTDAWATVANQTVDTALKEPRRLAFNAWLRDGAPMNSSGVAQAVGASGAGVIRAGQPGHPLAGYIEVADAVESARDSGKWKASYTTDGTHPNTTGATAIAAAIDPVPLFGAASI